jgi:hypothetical protein
MGIQPSPNKGFDDDGTAAAQPEYEDLLACGAANFWRGNAQLPLAADADV